MYSAYTEIQKGENTYRGSRADDSLLSPFSPHVRMHATGFKPLGQLDSLDRPGDLSGTESADAPMKSITTSGVKHGIIGHILGAVATPAAHENEATL